MKNIFKKIAAVSLCASMLAGCSGGSTGSLSYHSSSSSFDSYDEGYDDIYMNGDYDYDRYDSDDDYAAGVDDALDEDYEEW